jgi:hypothetical protein
MAYVGSPVATPLLLLLAEFCHRLFKHGVVCGYLDSTGQLALNPPEGAVPGPGSRLVQLTRRCEGHCCCCHCCFVLLAAVAQPLAVSSVYLTKLHAVKHALPWS